MSEQEQKKQKGKKKKKQPVIVKKETVESELPELIEALEELKKEKKHLDIQICPHCKSPKVRRVNSMGDVLGHMGVAPPKYECTKCGWKGKLVIKATNKPTSVKDVAIMAEANEAEQKK